MTRNLKGLLLFVALCCLVNNAIAQNDIIILRDGHELEAKVIQVDGKVITYKESAKSGDELHQDLRDVYMIRYEKRGNIYITDDCKRITGENNKWSKDADRIYLVEGKEIQAYNLNVGAYSITYTIEKKTKNELTTCSVSPHDVFMIKYADGTKDIITDISRKKDVDKVEQPVPETSETERKVIFHNVKKGDTLGSIARRYNVTEHDIIEWNDLPKSTKSSASLQSGKQLMMYVSTTN